jgi:methionyl-tRNA formyltransferase
LQDAVPLDPDDTFKSIYFGQVLPKSVDLLSRAVQLIREGQAPRIPQDLSQSTSNPPFTEAHGVIDWTAPVTKIYNTIRACDAWPGARTIYQGRTLSIWQAKKMEKATSDHEPGTVAEMKESGFVVNASGGGIFVERVQLEGGPKQMVADFLKTQDLTVGERLGE